MNLLGVLCTISQGAAPSVGGTLEGALFLCLRIRSAFPGQMYYQEHRYDRAGDGDRIHDGQEKAHARKSNQKDHKNDVAGSGGAGRVSIRIIDIMENIGDSNSRLFVNGILY